MLATFNLTRGSDQDLLTQPFNKHSERLKVFNPWLTLFVVAGASELKSNKDPSSISPGRVQAPSQPIRGHIDPVYSYTATNWCHPPAKRRTLTRLATWGGTEHTLKVFKGPWDMAEHGWSIGTLKVFKGPWDMAELGWSIGTLK